MAVSASISRGGKQPVIVFFMFFTLHAEGGFGGLPNSFTLAAAEAAANEDADDDEASQHRHGDD